MKLNYASTGDVQFFSTHSTLVDPTNGVVTNGLTLSGTTSDIILNASSGTSGNCLTSAGAGATPTWGSCGGGGTNGTKVYTSNQTASTADSGYLVQMNCSGACAYNLPATQPSTTFQVSVQTIGSTNATIALGGPDTFNGVASAPVLNQYRTIGIRANTVTSTDYVGDAPLVAGSNITLTPASNGLTVTASSTAGTALSSITAATTSNTAANGNNPQVWNWAQTTNSQTAFSIGETTAATGTSDQEVAISTAAGSTAVPLTVSNSLTGAQTVPALSITPTWNTTGVLDGALNINVTDTASGTGSLLFDVKNSGTSQFSVSKTGVTTSPTLTATTVFNIGSNWEFTNAARLMANTVYDKWTSNTSDGGTVDTIAGRAAANIWGVAAGTTPPSSVATSTGGVAAVTHYLGATGVAGSAIFGNATSGTVTLNTVTGALGSVTVSLPATTGTVALTSQLDLSISPVALPTSSIGANTCTAATGSPFTATGVTTSMVVVPGFASDPSAVVGYGSSGGLSVNAYPAANAVNVKVCNSTASPITPGALTVNIRIIQ